MSGFLRHHGLDVGDLLFRLESCVGDRDDLDALGRELRLQRGFLGIRPVVAAVVEHQRRLGVLGLHLAPVHRRVRATLAAGAAFSPFGPETEDLGLHRRQRGVGIGRRGGARPASRRASARHAQPAIRTCFCHGFLHGLAIADSACRLGASSPTFPKSAAELCVSIPGHRSASVFAEETQATLRPVLRVRPGVEFGSDPAGEI